MKPYTVVLLVPEAVCAALDTEPYGTEVYVAQVTTAPDWLHAINAAQVEACKAHQENLAEVGKLFYIHPNDYKMVIGFEGHTPVQFGWQWR